MSKKLLAIPLLVLFLVPVFLMLDGGDPADATGGAAEVEQVAEREAAAAPASLTDARAAGPDLVAPSEAESTAGPAQRTAAQAEAPRRTTARREGPTVQGRIVDGDGNPVPEATVQMKRPGEALLAIAGLSSTRTEEGVTDAFGRYELPGKPGEEVSFEISAPGFLAGEEYLTLPEDLGVPIEDFGLERGLVVWGRVVDPKGNPIVGAEIHAGRFWGWGGGGNDPDVVTDESGAFELPAEEPGEWNLRVKAEGHPTKTFEGEDEEAGYRKEELVCELPFAETIEGRVTGAPKHRLSTLKILAREAESEGRMWRGIAPLTAEIAASGTFVVEGLDPALEYELTAFGGNDPSMMFLAGGGGKDAARSDKLRVPAGAKDVEIGYRRGADAVFEVVAASTGDPIEDYVAEIGQLLIRESLLELSGEVRTHHPGGRDRFVDLRPMALDTGEEDYDRWTLTVEAPGFVPERLEDLFVPTSGEVDLGRVELQPAPSVTVRVVDDATGKPVRSAQVVLQVENEASEAAEDIGMIFGQLMAEPARRERTDREGEVTIASYGTRPCTLRVTKARYAVHTQEALVVGVKDKTVEVRLAREGEVTVRAIDGDGNPMGDVTVEIRPPDYDEDADDDYQEETTRSNGTVSVRKMQEGVWGFRLRLSWDQDDEDLAWTEVRVAPGSELEVELRGPRFSVVTGSVSLNGEPLKSGDGQLHPRDSDEESWSAANGWTSYNSSIGSDGEFRIEEVPYGDYWLAIESEELATRWIEPITVDAPEKAFAIQARTATVQGRVLDDQGRPVAGVSVRVSPFATQRGGNWWPASEVVGGSVVVEGGLASASIFDGLTEQEVGDNVTDANGQFTVAGVPPGPKMIVQVGGDLVEPGSSEPFALEVGELKGGIEVQVQPAGAVQVDVVWEDAPDFRFCRVKLEAITAGDEDPRNYSDQLWNEQVFSRGGIKPGSYRVKIWRGSFGNWSVDEDDTPDYESTIQIVAGKRTVHEATLIE